MNIEDVGTILIIGAGTMGSQIALQCAMRGYAVNLYDVSEEALKKGMRLIHGYVDSFLAQGALAQPQVPVIMERIRPSTDAQTAAQADLVSESVPEDPELKGKVFAQFNALCPPHTIFTTNTSSLVPSMIAQATGRPQRFAALHFHGFVWVSNVVDIMPHPATSAETIALLESFAKRIGQIPILLEKENYAYVFNSMLNALLRTATSLAARDVASYEDIDRAWMGVMKTPVGPFGILDQVGLQTAYDINQYWAKALKDDELQRNADFLKTYVDQGKLGVNTGQGFYSYPNPRFQQPGFLEGTD